MRQLSVGRIVVLNGVPRAGKSAAVRALLVRGVWLNLGVVAPRDARPPAAGHRPGCRWSDLEPSVERFYAALWGAVADVSRSGLDVACDVGLHTAVGPGPARPPSSDA